MSRAHLNLSLASHGAVKLDELVLALDALRARMTSLEVAFRAVHDAPDVLLKLVNIKPEPGAAGTDTADGLAFTLEPTELMNRLLAALRAGDRQLDAIQVELCHLGVLSCAKPGLPPGAGCGDPQESRESPGSDKGPGEERGQ